MVKRLVVHAGFHKTGTTTIQKTLAAHRKLLRPHMNIMLRSGMVALCEAARAWSVSHSALDLGLVRYEAALLAERWDQDTVLLSSEDLSGHMPGRRGLVDYSAAPTLAAAMVNAWQAARPGMAITLVYTTRAPEPWLASCHVQHLRAARMTMDAATYAATYAPSADLNAIIGQVRTQVPECTVETLQLEAHASNLIDPVLRLCDLRDAIRSAIAPLPPANTAPEPDRVAAMLDLNRSTLCDADWRSAKKSLLERWR